MQLLLLTKRACAPCRTAHFILTRLLTNIDPNKAVNLTTKTIDSDMHLKGLYGNRVPVVLFDGVEIGSMKLVERDIREAIKAKIGDPPHNSKLSD
mmetsp:Transcript_21974/g.40112  ORF Transcript_21974/g.40112 Transcript_21974/m.40112 type:complete len:95 (-) Transcript_21974:485-769(-)